MAFLRVLSGAPRFANLCGPVQSSLATVTLPGTIILPCLNLSSQARFASGMRVTAFEQAMQELYGDAWKQQLNCRQRSYVKSHEHRRQARQDGNEVRKAEGQGAPDAEQADEGQTDLAWRRKVEKKKMELRWQKKLLSPNPFRH